MKYTFYNVQYAFYNVKLTQICLAKTFFDPNFFPAEIIFDQFFFFGPRNLSPKFVFGQKFVGITGVNILRKRQN